MVNWTIHFGDTRVNVGEGKLVIAAPCLIEKQQELMWDLQNSRPRFEIYSNDNEKLDAEIPKIIAKHLLNLDGSELSSYFDVWLELLNIDLDKIEDGLWKKLIPSTKEAWYALSLEKKIALFAGASLKAHSFSLLFLTDIHLEANAQTFLFNFLKNVSSTSHHQLIVFWSYRLQIPNTVPVYFRGFGKNAA